MKAIQDHALWLRSNGSEGVRADFTNAIMRGLDLRGVDLRNAIMRGVDLSFSNLSQADIRGADLTNAIMHHTDLTETRYMTARFGGVDLSTVRGLLEHPFIRNNKITRAQAQDIYDRLCEGETGASLAEEYKISVMAVSNLRTGKTWPNIDRSWVPPSRTKLTTTQVREIQIALDGGEILRYLAHEYGVSEMTISRLRRKK